MAPARNDRAAPPVRPNGYEVRFLSNEAAAGWEDLARQAPGPLWTAWEILTTSPTTSKNPKRHAKLRGDLAVIEHNSMKFDQWQYEITGGGRIWFFVNESKATVWIKLASVGHPKKTQK